MKKKKQQHGEHDNSERWLLTYADLITLLLGLFVILYAMSKIDAGKYAELVAALGGVFGGGKPSVLPGNIGMLEQPLPPLLSERARIEEELRKAMKIESEKGLVSLTHDERGVTVHLQEELLFSSGSAELQQGSLNTLDALAAILKELPNDIRIEGHTDNLPINTPAFPSNWHLSVARAVNTGFYLLTKHGLAPERISVVGYSEYRPLVPNTSTENRARNRRVDIVIITGAVHAVKNQYSAPADSLFQSAKEEGK